jgi:hypothetical protein
MPQMSEGLRECPNGMLTAGKSPRAFARELNVNFSTTASYVVLENLAVHPTGLMTADHMQRQPRTSTSGFFTCRII